MASRFYPPKRQKKRKRIILAGIGLLVVLGLGAGIFIVVKKPWQSKVKLVDYQDEKFGFKLQYPEGFVVGKISEEQQGEEPLMLKLVRVDPPTLVLFWREGLGMVEAFVKKPPLQYLGDNVDRRYKVEYNDFKKEKVEETTLAGLEAFTVWFTFQDPEKPFREKIKLTVTVKESKGYYLQCMAPVEMWSQAEPSCDIIKESFEFHF